MISQYLLGFFAGGLSLLAPCVIPILPLIITSSLKSSKGGPLLNALGLTFSFTLFGILTNVFTSFFDPNYVQNTGAIILIFVGIILLAPSSKNFTALPFQKVSDLGNRLQNKIPSKHPLSEFLAGALLGMIWSPCTGPTLGLAIGLASKAQDLAQASLIFLFFGLGAGLGLVVLGFLIQRFSFLRNKLLSLGKYLNLLAGLLSIALGILILSGLDADLEDLVLSLLPHWLIQFSVQF
jgi:cytochrome c-type biogenesis protein